MRSLRSLFAILMFNIGAVPGIAIAQDDPNFGMPPDAAKAARARCAEVHRFYSTQVLCMQDEGKGYAALGYSPSRSPTANTVMPYNREDEERKARVLASSGYRYPNSVELVQIIAETPLCPEPRYRIIDPDGCWSRNAKHPIFVTGPR